MVAVLEVAVSRKLYEECTHCDGGRNHDRYCVACRQRGFTEIGLTAGQVKRMARLETAAARCYLADSGIDGPQRFTVRAPDGTVTHHRFITDAEKQWDEIVF